jgi:signal transduction histidine kinase
MTWCKVFLKRKFLFGLFLLVNVSHLVFSSSIVSPPVAKNGVLDLRSCDIEQGAVDLTGQFKFYWNQQLTPGKNQQGTYEYAEYPQLWGSTRWRGKPISTQGFATYKVKVIMPKMNKTMGIKLPHVYSSYRLFVNDKFIAADGVAGTTQESTTPYWSTQVMPLIGVGDTLDITLHVSNFSHSRGGPNKAIALGELISLQSDNTLNHAFDFFLGGSVLMAGLFFLGLYLFGKHDKSILYFSLFCFFYCYRIVGSNLYSLHSVFPGLPWDFAIHLEYISLFMVVTMFTMYTRELYPEDAPQRLMSAMAGFCMLFVIITLVFPPVVFSRTVNMFMIVVILYIAIASYIFWLAYKRRRIGAQYALISTVAVFVVIVSIILEYYHVAAPQKILLFVGNLSFFFCQSLILSFRFASTLKRAKEEAEMGLKVKSEFLSTMSHEIRTPLNSVLGMTHLLLKESPTPAQRSHLDVLMFSAKHLLALVNDILDLNILEAGQIRLNFKPMDISEIAHHIASGQKSFNLSRDVELLLEVDEGVPVSVEGDPVRTAQVITNLVHNSIKFTNTGWVKLKVALVEKTQNEVVLRISVQDTGIGIPAEKLKVIFERFTQVDSSVSRGFSGAGLGLAISKRILEMQGVELKVESEVDKGSEFYFVQRFQILKDKVVAPGQSERKVEKPLQGVAVLIVEDNQMNVLLSETMGGGIRGRKERRGSVEDIRFPETPSDTDGLTHAVDGWIRSHAAHSLYPSAYTHHRFNGRCFY